MTALTDATDGPAALLGAAWLYARARAHRRIHGAATAPPAPVAIVFGAEVCPDGGPSRVLHDRVATAADLYRRGTVRRLLLSGGPGEPEAMRRAALRLGVPDSALLLDAGGLRTYDSCARAARLFGVARALLVTQRFHLPRALFLCAALGIDADGVAADRTRFPHRLAGFWALREVGATARAWRDGAAAPAARRSITSGRAGA